MISLMLVMITLAQSSTPLAGTVVDETGKPIVAAELVLTWPKQGESPVVARGKSGEGGQFRLDRPTGPAAMDRYLVPALWAIAPGHRAAVMRFAGAMPSGDEPVRISLSPPAKTEFRVESPDGTPVAGARLSVQQVMPGWSSVPDPVADLAERATGPDGVAILDAFSPDEIGWVDVIAKGFGTQPRWLDPETPGPRRVTLKPVTALSGRLVPDQVEPKLMKGWHVRAWTRGPQGNPGEDTSAGYGWATTDDEGRFVLSEIAPGGLSLTVVPPGVSDLLPDLSKLPDVRQDQKNVVEIAIRRSATITGLAQERDTGKAVAGMRLVLFRPGQSSGVNGTTGADGRYSFRSLAGKARVWIPEAPSGYALRHFNRELEVPAGPAKVEVAAIELMPSAPLRGESRDEADQPVAGAEISAEWVLFADGKNEGYATRATADASGVFVLEGVAPGVRVKITARHHDRESVNPIEFDAGSREPLKVVLTPRPVVAVMGRVIGPGGVPVARAVVTIRGRETTTNRSHFAVRVQLQGIQSIKTGPDGTYRTPRELDRGDHEYQAEVTAAGYHPAKTPFVPAGAGDLLTLPDVALRKLRVIRTVSGRVIDRAGKPVAGASVSQAGDGPSRTATTANQDGRFHLAGVYEGPALIFAGKAGFRFGGAIVGPAAEPVGITLAREGEPPVALPKTLPSLMARTEERALARELLEPVLAGARSGSLGDSGAGAILALARVDPARVLTMLENRVVGNPAPVIVQVALGQFEDDPRAAVATIESSLDAATHAQGFLALAHAVPAADHARRDEFLERAYAEARRVSSAEIKLPFFREIADNWLDAGNLTRATPILREGQAVIAGLSQDNYLYQAEDFAEVLAVIDLPAAQAIFERKGMTRTSPPDDATIRRHLGEAAVRIAAFNPVEAERLSKEVDGPNIGDREWVRFRIARRMARADLTLARKMLESIVELPENPSFTRPELVPYGLGLIASDRAVSDPMAARGLLHQAFAGLSQIARSAPGQTDGSVSTLMAALIPVVEKVDPDRVAERLWLAASCRADRLPDPFAQSVIIDAILALRASRYDRTMAAVLAAPVFDLLPALLDGTSGWGFHDGRVFEVLAAYDPRAISTLLSTLPPSARRPQRDPNGNFADAPEALARVAAGRMLGMPIGVRRREATRPINVPASELPAE